MTKTNACGEFRKKKSPKNNKGFYIALAICVTAVAATAWTTYGNVVDYHELPEETVQDSEQPVDRDVSGESYERSLPQEESESSAQQESGPSSQASCEEEKQQPTVLLPLEEASVSKRFSLTEPLYARTTADWRVHRGVDLKAHKGAAVRAAADGVVKALEKDPLYGNIIRIDHADFSVSYCGLTDNSLVKEGDHVKAGNVIGYVGEVPAEMLEGDHLHLEAYVGDRPVDPMVLLQQRLSK